MNGKVKQLNVLAVRQFQLITNFIQVSKQLESILDEYRYNLSKTKSILGFATVEGLLEDNREMQPTLRQVFTSYCYRDGSTRSHLLLITSCSLLGFRFDIDDDGIFTVHETNAGDSTVSLNFRPFGVLEPQSVRNARRNIFNAFPLICELASLKVELLSLEKEYQQIRSEL